MIRPTFTIPPGTREQFVQRTKKAAQRAAVREHNQIASAWAEELNKILNEEFERREGYRHKANTAHLHDSFVINVTEGPDAGFPVETTLRTKNGVSTAKILSLNSGSRPHEIESKTSSGVLTWRTPGGSLFHTPKVGAPFTADHPGTKPSRFLERSRAAALKRRRR